MPLNQVLKGYKKLLWKIQVAQLDEPTAAVQQKSAILSGLDRASFEHISRLKGPAYSLERAFGKLQLTLVELNTKGPRVVYQESKQRAKDRIKSRLQRALDSKYGRYLSGQRQQQAAESTAPSTSTSALSSAARSQQMDELFGTNGFLRRAVLYLVSSASRSVMHKLNSTTVEGMANMEAALQRPADQPLITVCNHVAAMDDPLVMTAIIPPEHMAQPEHVRWTLCATDRCFRYKFMVPFFRAGKVLPVQRGAGLDQPGMQAAEEALRRGEWVHIFPEGTRTKNPKEMGPIRKGIGRLVASSPVPPMVLPFVHGGMEDIMPRGKALPSIGHEVKVVVGEPVPVADLLEQSKLQGWSDDQLYSAVAARVGVHLRRLQAQLSGQTLDAAEVAQPSTLVSPLDLYDYADLVSRKPSLWEAAKFKMQHRSWHAQQRLEQYKSRTAARLQHVRAEASAVKTLVKKEVAEVRRSVVGAYQSSMQHYTRSRTAQMMQMMNVS